MSASSQLQPIVRAALARRSNLIMRLLTTVVAAAVLHAVLGMAWAWLWGAVYAVTQLIEVAMMRPLLADPQAPVSRGRRFTFLAMLALTSTVFGAMSLPLFASPDAVGPAVAILMLAGAILNVIVVNTGWRSAALCAGGPHIAYVFIGPAVANIVHPDLTQLMGLWVGALLLAIASAVASLTLERALRAEAEAKAEAQARQAEAEAAVAAKSAFVAMISHELRTPISAILAGAHDLARTEGKAGQARLIGDAGRMMRALLDDLLDLSRLEAHRMEVEVIAFDLRQVVLDVVRMWRPVAREKGLRLTVEGAAVLPGWVEGDPTRVRQVLNNLISNAIKFTREGSVTLQIGAEPSPVGHRISLAVADTGPGMTPEQVSRLFTAFDQLGAGTARKHGGSGLGLFISRQLARLMGGDLVASSDPGQGAVFALRLTLPSAAMAPRFATELALEPVPVPAPAATGPARVLVVDDHVVNRQAIALMLDPAGVVPTMAASAEEALDILARETFDVVMMDIYMPDMDGREATRRLRAVAGPNRTVPVIAITASATAKDWDACREAGMTHHVAKPIDPAALYAALEAALRGDPAGDEDQASAAA